MRHTLKKFKSKVTLSILIPGIALFLIVSILSLLSLSDSALLDSYVTEARAGVNLQRLGFERITPSPTPQRSRLVDENFTPAPDSCRITLRFAQTNQENEQLDPLDGVSFTLVSLVNEENPQTLEAIADFEGEFFRTSSNMRSGNYRVSVQREGFQSETVTILHSAPENCDHTIVLLREGEEREQGNNPTNTPIRTPTPSRSPTSTRTPTPSRTPTPVRQNTVTPRPDNTRTCPLTIQFVDESNREREIQNVAFILDRVTSQNPLALERIMDNRDFDEGVLEIDPAQNGQYRIIAWLESRDLQVLTFTHAGNICDHQVVLATGDEQDNETGQEPGDEDEDTGNQDRDEEPSPTPENASRPTLTPPVAGAMCEMVLIFNLRGSGNTQRIRYDLERILEENGEDVVTEVVQSNQTALWPVSRISPPMPSGRYRVMVTQNVEGEEPFEHRFDHQAPNSETCQHIIELAQESRPSADQDDRSSRESDETGDNSEPEARIDEPCDMRLDFMDGERESSFVVFDLDRIGETDNDGVSIIERGFTWFSSSHVEEDMEPGRYRVRAARFNFGNEEFETTEVTHGGPDSCRHSIPITSSGNGGEDESENQPTEAPEPSNTPRVTPRVTQEPTNTPRVTPGASTPTRAPNGGNEAAACRMQFNFEFDGRPVNWALFTLTRPAENGRGEEEILFNREFSWGSQYITRNAMPDGIYLLRASRSAFLELERWVSFELDHASPDNCVHTIELNPEAVQENGDGDNPEGRIPQAPAPSNTPQTPLTRTPTRSPTLNPGGNPRVALGVEKQLFIENETDQPLLVTHIALEQSTTSRLVGSMSLETNFTVPPRSRSGNIEVMGDYCEQFSDRLPADNLILFRVVYVKGDQRINFWKNSPGFLKFNWESKPEPGELNGSRCDQPEVPAVYTVR